MIKKINILLVLLLLFISISAVSAADDLNETIGSDEAILDSEVIASDEINNEKVSSDNIYSVNSSNYATYFNDDGQATSAVKSGDTISIEGDFSKKNFTFKTPVNIVGLEENKLENCIFTFYGDASGSNVSSLNIINTIDYHYGIFLNGASNCLITGCTIVNKGLSSYPICVANNANYNNVTDNYLKAYGIREGYDTWSIFPLVISGSHYNYIANNQLECQDANGIYLSSFSGGPLKGGNSNFNIIYNNIVHYNVLPTSWSYGIQLMGLNNTVKANKIIGAFLGISGGQNSLIIDNSIINITGADYNHIGVEVGGDGAISAAKGSIVRNNTIINAKVMATGAGISVSDDCTVEDNYIEVKLNGVGIAPGGSGILIKNNTIITDGSSGISNAKGMITSVNNLTIIQNNIVSKSGVGILIKKTSSKNRPKNIVIRSNTINNTNYHSIDGADIDPTSNWDIDYNTIINKNAKVSTPEGVYDPSKYYYNYKGNTHYITPENYNDFIDKNGIMLSSKISDGDILSFSGEFTNKYIYVNNAVKITGTNPTFYNTTFRVSSGGVWIENLNIINNRCERINAWGLLIYNVTSVTVLNCTIDVYDPNAAYAIYVLESNEIDIINNTLSSEGKYLTYTILAHTVYDCKLVGNTIFTNGTGEVYKFEGEHCLEGNSVCTDGSSVCTDGNSVCPDGNSVGGSHVLKEVYRTYGILMVYSSDNVISKNKVKVTSKLNQTYAPPNSTNSIVGIDLYYNSHNNLFSENDVIVWGNDNYLYGMGVLGYYTTMIAPLGQGAENNQFINNNINVKGQYCAEGIIIGSSSEDTTVVGNVIDVNSDCVIYGITLEVSQKSNVKNNNLTLNSEIIYGIEAFDSSDNVLNNNNLKINAIKAYGIVFSRGHFNEIKSNTILIELEDGATVQNVSVKHNDQIKPGIAGIYLQSYSSNNTIDDNNITISKGYAINLDEDAIDNVLSNNYLFSPIGTGDNAINSTENNTIKDNYVHLVTGTFENVYVKYLENGTLTFKTDDINLNGAKVEFIDLDEKIINVTGISNGVASFTYDFDRLEPAIYFAYVKIYKENYKITTLTCTVDIADGDLILSVNNVTGIFARNANYVASVKNILGEGVSGLTVEFYVNDEGYPVYVGKAITDKDGIATLTAEIPRIYDENPTILAEIIDPYHFNPTSATANISAIWLIDTKITLNNNINSGGNLAILKDSNGNVLPNKPVNIVIGSKNYPMVTDSNGCIIMPIMPRGSYSISVSFEGDDDYYESQNSAKINILPSLLENKDFTVYYGNVIKYKVRAKGSDGKYSAGNVVTIKVNGKTYHVKTDKNGYATQALKLKSGSYIITAEFNGDKVSNKLTFKPTLIAKNIVKKKAKKIKFSVKVVNKNGKVVKNKKVSFKVKGKKYTAKTNKKGVATVSIKNLKIGKFTIASSYGGCTVKNTIKIKK